MKGARTVILIETIVLITIVVSAGSIYSRVKAEDDVKDRLIAELQEQYRDLAMRYEDINWQFNELQERADAASSDQQTAVSPDDDIERQLEYERRRYKELEDAFDGLAVRFDELVLRAEAQDTVPFDEFVQRAGRITVLPDEDSDRRRERDRRSDLRGLGDEFIDGQIEDLQKRIDSTDDPDEQERLTAVGNAVQDMRDLRDRIRDAESEADRQQAVGELNELRRQLSELVSGDSRRGGGRRRGRRGPALTDQPQNP